ncbi:MAG: D-tyrosyl-tRNA(Tyr) deacylase [Erysipelotrichaceae bacterium]|nr:D-tyrosyl-tRNA(Tyr) deacylase [Erysipelotrichaceae bacterium]
MKVVLQRVKHASVTIDGNVYGKINQGYLLLVGITDGDTETEAKKLADKIVDLRIFEDENGKMNLGIEQVNGAILSISQFTLYADCKKGRRPSFTKAARPEISNPLYETFNGFLKDRGMHVETGIFGADMKVELLNDGPVTIILDSNEL